LLPSFNGYTVDGAVSPVVLLHIWVVLFEAVPLPDTVLVNVRIDVYWLLGWEGCITYEPTPLATKLDNALLINDAFKLVSVCSCNGYVLDIYSNGLTIPDSSLFVPCHWRTVVVLTVVVAPEGVVWPPKRIPLLPGVCQVLALCFW